jgi:hypothetical protein
MEGLEHFAAFWRRTNSSDTSGVQFGRREGISKRWSNVEDWADIDLGNLITPLVIRK